MNVTLSQTLDDSVGTLVSDLVDKLDVFNFITSHWDDTFRFNNGIIVAEPNVFNFSIDGWDNTFRFGDGESTPVKYYSVDTVLDSPSSDFTVESFTRKAFVVNAVLQDSITYTSFIPLNIVPTLFSQNLDGIEGVVTLENQPVTPAVVQGIFNHENTMPETCFNFELDANTFYHNQDLPPVCFEFSSITKSTILSTTLEGVHAHWGFLSNEFVDYTINDQLDDSTGLLELDGVTSKQLTLIGLLDDLTGQADIELKVHYDFNLSQQLGDAIGQADIELKNRYDFNLVQQLGDVTGQADIELKDRFDFNLVQQLGDVTGQADIELKDRFDFNLSQQLDDGIGQADIELKNRYDFNLSQQLGDVTTDFLLSNADITVTFEQQLEDSSGASYFGEGIRELHIGDTLDDVTNRFVLGNFVFRTPVFSTSIHSVVEQAELLNHKKCPITLQAELIRRETCTDTSPTETVTRKTCTKIGSLPSFSDKTCVSQLSTYPIGLESCEIIGMLDILSAPKWCIIVENAKPLASEVCETLEQPIFNRVTYCSVVQDTTKAFYNDTYSYFTPPPVGLEYYRNCDFVIDGSVIIGSYNFDHYEAQLPLCFDHVNSLPTDTFNFTETNVTVVYDHYSSTGADTTCDFELPYSSSVASVVVSHFHGIFHNRYCDKIENLSKITKKLCSIIEEACPLDEGTSPWIDPPRPPIVIDPNNPNIIIPILETYCMEHLTTVTLPDLTTHIDIENISLPETSDGFSINFSATLVDHSQTSLLANYQKLHITINGELWIVIVEEILESEQFNNKTVSLKGRGITSLLSDPHIQEASVAYNTDLTVQQIADNMLPIGWTIVWEMPVWLVPAGSYSHDDKAPAKALLELAHSIGAMVVAHKSLQELTIKPRYAVKPWDFASGVPELVVPLDVVDTITRIVPPVQNYNGIYVHGLEQGGEIGFCRMNGTAGDILAKTKSNSLMTHPTGIRALAEKELSDLSTQPTVKNFKIPFDNVIIPLVRIGQFIEVGGVRGVVNSVTVNSSFGIVTQSIQIGNKTSNTWSNFQSMLPKNPLQVVTLNSNIGTSAALVTLINGGVLRVTGNGVLGANYYIKDGVIQGKAPTLPSHVIVI